MHKCRLIKTYSGLLTAVAHADQVAGLSIMFNHSVVCTRVCVCVCVCVYELIICWTYKISHSYNRCNVYRSCASLKPRLLKDMNCVIHGCCHQNFKTRKPCCRKKAARCRSCQGRRMFYIQSIHWKSTFSITPLFICRLKPRLEGTPANIRINLIGLLPETRLYLCPWKCRSTLSSYKCSWLAPKDARVLKQSA